MMKLLLIVAAGYVAYRIVQESSGQTELSPVRKRSRAPQRPASDA